MARAGVTAGWTRMLGPPRARGRFGAARTGARAYGPEADRRLGLPPPPLRCPLSAANTTLPPHAKVRQQLAPSTTSRSTARTAPRRQAWLPRRRGRRGTAACHRVRRGGAGAPRYGARRQSAVGAARGGPSAGGSRFRRAAAQKCCRLRLSEGIEASFVAVAYLRPCVARTPPCSGWRPNGGARGALPSGMAPKRSRPVATPPPAPAPLPSPCDVEGAPTPVDLRARQRPKLPVSDALARRLGGGRMPGKAGRRQSGR